MRTKIISTALFIGILVVVTGCSGTSIPDNQTTIPSTKQTTIPSTKQYENVASVAAALKSHTLSNGDKPYYELIGAYDGMKYDVQPGDYRLEIYVYHDLTKIPNKQSIETIDNQVYIEGNLLLLLHTTDKTYLDSLLSDLHNSGIKQ